MYIVPSHYYFKDFLFLTVHINNKTTYFLLMNKNTFMNFVKIILIIILNYKYSVFFIS